MIINKISTTKHLHNQRAKRTSVALVTITATAALLGSPTSAANASPTATAVGSHTVQGAAAAKASKAKPAIAVSATTVKRGELLAVAGKQFKPKARYRIYLATKRTTTGTITKYGTAFRTVAFPKTIAPGKYPATIAAYKNGKRIQKATVFVTVTH